MNNVYGYSVYTQRVPMLNTCLYKTNYFLKLLHLLFKIEHKFSVIKRSTQNYGEVTQQRFVEKEISGTRYKNKD